MNHDNRRLFGIAFESTSIDQAAAKCTRAAATWGGSAMVFVDSSGLIEAVKPGTIDGDTTIKYRAADLVGTYQVPHQRDRHADVRRLIAEDIWCHINTRKAA
jgi:hypothetical protein